MSKAVEIINAAVSPVNKLIDAISGAIGKVYEPTHIKRIAKAEAKEIELIGQALRENADVPIKYDKGEITADITNFEEFVKRTEKRLAYQELLKQKNIESVTGKAYNLLENESECTSEPINTDWLIRFYNSVQDISDEDMQTLWAKILAGEVIQPKKYSLRTLETLKNLSKEEAQLFQKIAPSILCTNGRGFIASSKEAYEIQKIKFSDILALSECGLLSSQNFVAHKVNIEEDQYCNYLTKNYLIKLEVKKAITLSFGVYSLTNSGAELYDIIDRVETDENAFVSYIEAIFKSYLDSVVLSIYKIINIVSDTIECDATPVKIFGAIN